MNDDDPWLIYDGECPFCKRYVAMTRLRQAIGNVRLIDARQGGPEFEEMQAAGFDVNEGMLLKLEGEYYFGADCLNRLALLSTRSDLFNKFCAFVFRSQKISRLAYPVLRCGRNLTLRLLKRDPIARSN